MSPISPTPDSQRRTQAMAKLSGLVSALASVMNDRQPDSQKQTAETEWRRQRDISLSINRIRDVLVELLNLIQEGGLAQLVVQGQLLASNGDAEVPLDPPRGAAGQFPAILTYDATHSTPTSLKWDGDLFAQIQACCGTGGGISDTDYGSITAPPDLSFDYGFVTSPPTSTADWGGLD